MTRDIERHLRGDPAVLPDTALGDTRARGVQEGAIDFHRPGGRARTQIFAGTHPNVNSFLGEMDRLRRPARRGAPAFENADPRLGRAKHDPSVMTLARGQSLGRMRVRARTQIFVRIRPNMKHGFLSSRVALTPPWGALKIHDVRANSLKSAQNQ